MKDWKNILISPDTKIQQTLKIIDVHSLQIALVVDSEKKLIGTVTDGDIRRGLLRGVSLNAAVAEVMNSAPVSIPYDMQDKHRILTIMQANKFRHLPVVNEAGCVVGIERLEDLLDAGRYDNWVIVMAGGLGSRLRPLTDDCPKPMLPVGGKPVLETILEHFLEQGFHRFCFSVNYKAEQIQQHFGDGSKWGATIRYLHENKRMGTAGSLSLFPVKTEKPIIVMNGDILTTINFGQFISFHLEQQSEATLAVRTYDIQVPYGVVKVNKDKLIGFEEKPVYTSFINAGVYALNPKVLERIPKNAFYDMNQLFDSMLRTNERVSIFPVREYWIDIGEISNFRQAERDFSNVFEKK